MSTILKALERLEKDKPGGARAEGASELAVVRPGVPQEPRRRWPWIAGGIGALALTGVLALWLRPLVEEPPAEPQGPQVGVRQLGSETPPIPPAVPPALEEPVAVAAVEPAPAPAPAPAPTPSPSSPASAVVPGPQAPSPGAGAEQIAPPATPAAPPEPALQAAAPAPVAPPASPEPAPVAAAEPLAAMPTPEPAPIVEPEPAPPPPAREVLRPRPTAPKPRPAPAVARAPEPKVAVERTIWHPDATRRRAWVRLEGRASAELREGDSLGGIAVRRIEPSGVVFAFEGRELRRAVGALP